MGTNHYQELKLVEPDNDFKYYGIFAVDGDAPGLKGGINERGLVVIMASASSIPRQQRLNLCRTKAVLFHMLN